MKTRKFWLTTLMLGVLLLTTALAAAQNATGTVTAGALNLRAQPTVNAQILAQLPYGTRVNVAGRNAAFTWYYVNTGHGPGWVSAAYLAVDYPQNVPVLGTTPPPATPTPAPVHDVYAIVNTGALNVRAIPSGINNSPIGRLYYGNRVQVIGRTANNGWYQINFNAGAVGWIDADYTYISQGNLGTVPVKDGAVTPPPGNVTASGYVNTGALNIRSIPDWRNNTPLLFVFRGTQFTIIGRTADAEWYQVRLSSGLVGWVRGRYVTITNGNIYALPVTG